MSYIVYTLKNGGGDGIF